MNPGTRYASAVVTLTVSAIVSLWFAHYVIEDFFPDVSLIDLAAFCAVGLVSGLATGISWALSKTLRPHH